MEPSNGLDGWEMEKLLYVLLIISFPTGMRVCFLRGAAKTLSLALGISASCGTEGAERFFCDKQLVAGFLL
jgi:hypothetical protein